jgi:hypothetical protein
MKFLLNKLPGLYQVIGLSSKSKITLYVAHFGHNFSEKSATYGISLNSSKSLSKAKSYTCETIQITLNLIGLHPI